MDFTTEEFLLELKESSINITEEEAHTFRDHEVDGETLECGLTDTMVSSLFGSFKKQAQFLEIIRENKMITPNSCARVRPTHWSCRKLCIEVDRMRPTDVNLCQLWRQNVTKIVPKVIELVQGKTPPAKVHSAAREEILMEEIQDVYFRAALILLPYLFKEKIERVIILCQSGAFSSTPYPTVQLTDWKTVFTRRIPVSVMVDGTDLCQGSGVEGMIAVFCAYYVFNLEYPPYLKNTLTFLQHLVLNISEVGEKALLITVTRMSADTTFVTPI